MISNNPINIVQVYAPTNTNRERDPSLKIQFYIDMSKALDLNKMGEFNSKIDKNSSLTGSIGRFSMGTRHSGGEAIFDLIEKLKLCMENCSKRSQLVTNEHGNTN